MLPNAGREVRDVGQQRLAADLRSGSRAGQGLARAGDDGGVQITVAVNQAAVNAGGTGDRGDADALTELDLLCSNSEGAER
ncbi:hypothetical protein [Streptomyces yangpuensis]|uniref:Uncharacterized protein n=1 Tax=Streptomyces yangpuensis TaxID=1648182 RepID=A0ABY5Q875_9ACTN|nr:hypothetical protein [Streptomyces yangpuensis]UUY52434.1 hypothetical protein NRK68_34810 [Streptomyces yangpuensis]